MYCSVKQESPSCHQGCFCTLVLSRMPKVKVSWLLCHGRLVFKIDNIIHCARLVKPISVDCTERNNSYYFSRENQQKEGPKFYSLTQCSLTVNECDWHILARELIHIVWLVFIYRSLQQSLHRFTQTKNVDEMMKVVLQEIGQQTREVSDDIDSVEPDSDVPDGIPMPPPLFNRQRSPLDGTPWQHNVHAQQLLDKMNKPSTPMIGLPWKKVDRLTGATQSFYFTMKYMYFWYF